MQPKITVQVNLMAPVEKAWEVWTNPEHIKQWCHASDDWHAPSATNDLRADGRFTTRMESVDGAMGFDFGGEYTEVKNLEKIVYKMDDGREVITEFVKKEDGSVDVIESFDPEGENPREMQQAGWQSILENYKKHVLTS